MSSYHAGQARGSGCCKLEPKTRNARLNVCYLYSARQEDSAQAMPRAAFMPTCGSVHKDPKQHKATDTSALRKSCSLEKILD